MTRRNEQTEAKAAGDTGPRAKDAARGNDPITIKKYANRRLYNTQTSSYVTLDYLSEMVKQGQDFLVFDAKTGEDITRSVLTQIIFEEENKGQNLLPIQFLRQLIRFYGDSMQAFVPSYLEMSMETFAKNQEQLRQQVSDAFGAGAGYKMFEETVRQNMAFFDQAMKMFAPFGKSYGERTDADVRARRDDEVDALKAQIEALRQELEKSRGA